MVSIEEDVFRGLLEVLPLTVWGSQAEFRGHSGWAASEIQWQCLKSQLYVRRDLGHQEGGQPPECSAQCLQTPSSVAASSSGLTSAGLHALKSWTFGSNLLFWSGAGGWEWPEREQSRPGSTLPLLLFQGSAPILVAMVILLNIGVAILFINFFI